ncbi:MAG: ABC transporter permease [Thermomicrobiales bacterium]|nr:ABC transporter permease [Thermomicrobiales bacterium]MCO5217864.1 ABC transporter permease [Thermomicrobiales bacterium]MCO5223883.1 ABC transporter permease [Thermomicrobiales bacterium]MCO5227447.1 ABC transporter permease [Thermomicrobiales bacterium]
MTDGSGSGTVSRTEDSLAHQKSVEKYLSLGAAERDHLKETPGFYTRAWRRLKKDRVAIIALLGLVLIILFTIIAPLLERWVGVTYTQTNLRAALLPPGGTYVDAATGETTRFWMGTDGAGRDILVRLAYGGRVSMMVATLALIFSLLIGMTIGAVAGFLGGFVDTLLMRFVDTLMCIPSITLLLLFSVWMKPGPVGLAFVIALLGWTGVSRLIRGEVLSLKQRDYVDAARVLGASNTTIIVRHIFPNVVSLVIVWASLALPSLILYEATLSYLGFGVRMPDPSWGNMLNEARELFRRSWWFTFFPGMAILLTALCINLLGNGLRDALDPRLNER